MKVKDNIVVALDVGTTKVVCLVARLNSETRNFELIGIGRSPNKGVRRGVVVDIEETVRAIATALNEARYMGDCNINSVYLNVGGSQLYSFNSVGMVAIKNREVTQNDVMRVIDTANAVSIPADHEFLNVLPQKYRIDNQEEIMNPIGMSGTRLEVSTHILTNPRAISQNITKCAMKCNVRVDNLIVSPLASAAACLTEDEKNLGVCLIDIGGGTTDISVYANGCAVFNKVLPVSGEHITSDLATMLRASTSHAEEIKCRYGSLRKNKSEYQENISFPRVGDGVTSSQSRQAIFSVIYERVNEIFQMVYSELEQADLLNYLNAGLVLTGGASKMEGIEEVAVGAFKGGWKVRLATPQYSGVLSDILADPSLSTAYGILLCSDEYRHLAEGTVLEKEDDWIFKLWASLKTWFMS